VSKCTATIVSAPYLLGLLLLLLLVQGEHLCHLLGDDVRHGLVGGYSGCHGMCYAMLCYAMVCYAMLWYAVVCYAMLWYAMVLLWEAEWNVIAISLCVDLD
jgi:hypothetical protein